MELYNSFTEFEKNYQGEDAIAWTRNHAEIPVFAVGLYLWFIFYFLFQSIINQAMACN